MDDLSPDYWNSLEESKRHHAASKTYSGSLLRPHAPFIKAIINSKGCKTGLDYGCGKGVQYAWVMPSGQTLEQYWGFPIRKYDPAYPPFAEEPSGLFDLVICTHTLGTIPIDDLPKIIKRIFSFASKAVYFAEKIQPVKKNVVTDREKHPIGWSVDQWLSALVGDWNIPAAILTTREIMPDGSRVMRWHDLKSGHEITSTMRAFA